MALIAIDGVKLSGKPCGLSNIALSIIESLSIIGDNKIMVIMKAPPHPEIDIELKKYKNVEVLILLPLFLKSISIFWSLFQINGIIKTIKPDLFIAPNFLISPFKFNKEIKTAVFVHDLVIKEFPETMHWFNRLHMLLLFKYSLKKASVLWCNSNYTASQLKQYYPLVEGKKIFIGSGVNSIYQTVVQKSVKTTSNKVKKPYIVYVGNIEPRKNTLFLLKLFDNIHEQYELVMIGGKGWGKTEEEVQKYLNYNPQLISSIHRLSNISTKQLIELYSNAAFLISTSFNEGLGLPLLEAMACSCPSLTPHNSAFIEIVGDTGITVKTWNIQDWLLGMNSLMENRNIHVEKGLQKIKNYNWLKVSGQFLNYINIQ